MTNAKIMIVESNPRVAEDIAERLTGVRIYGLCYGAIEGTSGCKSGRNASRYSFDQSRT